MAVRLSEPVRVQSSKRECAVPRVCDVACTELVFVFVLLVSVSQRRGDFRYESDLRAIHRLSVGLYF